MYYPFLRGKREELLALQELLESERLSQSIVPIIEPIGLSSTLISTLESFQELNRDLYIIKNPIVGNLKGDISITKLPEDEINDLKDIKKNKKALEIRDKYIDLLKHSSNIKSALYFCNDFIPAYQQLQNEEDISILFQDDDEVETFVSSQTYPDHGCLCFIPETGYRKDILNHKLVLFRDKFNRRSSNVLYADNVDEFFSKDHVAYQEYEYSGFSDYSIIGKKYDDSGFAPYAIAIHIIYPKNKGILRIRHFVSDTNDSAKDPARKFKEAMEKLVAWNQDNSLTSLGLQNLIQCYEAKNYPGLGSIKRFSIMHHLEIVGTLLK